MARCKQWQERLEPYLDGALDPLSTWRMARHLKQCPSCARSVADERCFRDEVCAALRCAESDTAQERAALDRVTQSWVSGAAGAAVSVAKAPTAAPPRRMRPFLTASALAGACGMAFAFWATTAPSRALGDVAGAMRKVQAFHIQMELPGLAARYEAWGQRKVGVRVEGWEGGERTLVFVDDGKALRRWDLDAGVLRESPTRITSLYRRAANFNASRLLRQAAQGELFAGEEWLGKATAREVARVHRGGSMMRRIQIDLKDGFFEKMIVYARAADDRLQQANLYTDARMPEEDPFARVTFEYPPSIPERKFQLDLPKGTPVITQPVDGVLPQ